MRQIRDLLKPKLNLFSKVTSNDIIVGNGRVLKAYMYIMGKHLFEKYNANTFFLFTCGAQVL